jgi:type VI secretion system secreted protein Hcp
MAIDAFLDFKNATPKIEGEAFDQTFNGTFHCKSFTFTVAQKGTAVTGGGMGAGKADFEDFEFTIDTQKGSAALMKHCAAGTHFQNVKLHVRKAGGGTDPSKTQKVFLMYSFSNVLISSYSTSGEEDSTDTVKFNFTSVYTEYKAQDTKTGELESTPTRGGWDLKLNKEATQ